MAEKHEIVAHDDWLASRAELLAAEKEYTRLRDELSRRRRALPWEAVEKDTPSAARTAGGRWPSSSAAGASLSSITSCSRREDDEGCPHCSFWADSFDANAVHLQAPDVTLVAVSRAPLATLEAYERRLGWSFPWYS